MTISDKVTVTIHVDRSELDAALMDAKRLLETFRQYRRPWWCPRWIYNMLNDKPGTV